LHVFKEVPIELEQWVRQIHWFLHPSHQRDSAPRPIGTGRLRACRRFGYWGEQIGHLRGQSGYNFGTRRQNSSLQRRVGVETAIGKRLSLPVVRRLIVKEQHQIGGSSPSPATFRQISRTPYDLLRFRTHDVALGGFRNGAAVQKLFNFGLGQ
jgi:hypothetical protein